MVGVISREAAVQANSIALHLSPYVSAAFKPRSPAAKRRSLAFSLHQEMRELFQASRPCAEGIARLSHRLLLITSLLFSHIYEQRRPG